MKPIDIISELRKLRKYQEISRKDLALKSGLNVNTINSIEIGRAAPTLNSVHKLASGLGYELKLVKKGAIE